jgi:hypothetical protein
MVCFAAANESPARRRDNETDKGQTGTQVVTQAMPTSAVDYFAGAGWVPE